MSHTPSHAAYQKTTFIWGNLTLAVGLLISTSLPFYLMYFADVDVTWPQILKAFLAVFAVYGVFYVVEPLTYYPILGPAGMYQAFMIGNIANKLLPSAIVAQAAINEKPGSRKASYAATAAICGAAFIHVISMLLLVGVLGTWLVTVIPDHITDIARLYIIPAILGGVAVQLIATVKQLRATLIALACSAFVVFGLTVWIPALKAGAVGIAVLMTIVLTWFLRKRDDSTNMNAATIN